jgi:hypothetical protein
MIFSVCYCTYLLVLKCYYTSVSYPSCIRLCFPHLLTIIITTHTGYLRSNTRYTNKQRGKECRIRPYHAITLFRSKKNNKEKKNIESDHTTPYHCSGRKTTKTPFNRVLYSSPRPTPYSHVAPPLTHSSHGRPLLHDYTLSVSSNPIHSFYQSGVGIKYLQPNVYVCSADIAGRRCGYARRGSSCSRSRTAASGAAPGCWAER